MKEFNDRRVVRTFFSLILCLLPLIFFSKNMKGVAYAEENACESTNLGKKERFWQNQLQAKANLHMTKEIKGEGKPPSIPKNLKQIDTDYTSYTLAWDPSIGTQGTLIRYHLYKDYETTPFATTADNTYVVKDLEPDMYTFYTVTAVDDLGNESGHSNELLAHTLIDTEKPTKPLLKLEDATMTSIMLSWSGSTDNVKIASYQLFQDGKPISELLPSTINQYKVENLTPDSRHTYYLKVFDSSENENKSDLLEASTLKDYVVPEPVKNFHVENITKNSVKLSWLPASDNVGVVRYELYRNGKLLTNNDFLGLEFQDTNLEPGTFYEYTIKAFDVAGNFSKTETVTVTTVKPRIQLAIHLKLTNPGEGSGHDIFEFYTTDGYLELYTEDNDWVAKFFQYRRGDSTDYDYDQYSYTSEVDFDLYKKIKETKKLYVWGGIREADFPSESDDNIMYAGYHQLKVETFSESISASGRFSGDKGDGDATFTISFTEQ